MSKASQPNKKFFLKLIDKGLIKENTIAELDSLPGKIKIKAIADINDKVLFKGLNENNQTVKFFSESIKSIDGMDPIRLGKDFLIKPDGSAIPPGKKRGRKPKNLPSN